MRIRARRLRRAPELAARAARELARTPGFERVKTNARTGSIVLHVDPDLEVLPVLAEVARTIATIEATAPAPEPRRAAAATRREDRDTRKPSANQDTDAILWHTHSIEQLAQRFGSDVARGWTHAQAAAHLQREGENRLPVTQMRSSFEIAFEQLNTAPVLMLLGSAGLSIATAGIADAVVILGIVCVNAAIGYWTESTAERTIRALTAIEPEHAHVLRDGVEREVPLASVVAGDVLVLARGAYVAADARLIEAHDLTIDESTLTGESVPVAKQTATLTDTRLPLADRTNMVYRGTLVTGGSGRALVIATGAHTEGGRIRVLLDSARPPQTIMQRELVRLGRYSAIVAGGASALVFVLGLLRGESLIVLLRRAISLAVAAVPEGLPTVSTATLSLGLRRMQAQQVLVRRLDAIETLAAIDTVCLDKTGTITANHMTVTAIAVDGTERVIAAAERHALLSPGEAEPELRRLCELVALCSEVQIDRVGDRLELAGTATEIALVQLAQDAGIDVVELRASNRLVHTSPRSTGRNRMSTLHQAGSGARLLAVKGSPSEVLACCTTRLRGGKAVALTQAERELIEARNDGMAGQALRVLAVAFRELAPGEQPDERGLTWVGLVGMADPPRAEVDRMIAALRRAAIDTIMITGDQSATAYAVGRAIGLGGNTRIDVLDVAELQRMSDDVLASLVRKVQVFSRVSPADKLKIVRALQRGGRVVAMTGDGINDGPALKAADVGVAMGAGGSNVAREVADLVLAEDDLGRLIAAIREGRAIYEDIAKAVRFMFATNLSEVLVTLAAAIAGAGEAISPMHLMWINLVSDTFPELALAVQPPDADVLARPPHESGRPFFDKDDLGRVVLYGSCIGAGSVIAYASGRPSGQGGGRASTRAFLALTGAQLLHVLSARSDTHSVFDEQPLARNRYVPMSIAGGLGSTLLAQFSPLRSQLGSARLGVFDWLAVLACALGPFVTIELGKRFASSEADDDVVSVSAARKDS